MTSYKRGDVILVRYPNSDLKTYKKRPALVIQSDRIETGLPQQIVALITSNLSRTGSTRVLVERNSPVGQQMGIQTDSVIMTDNLATVLEREIDQLIGNCPILEQVDLALKTTLDL
jgi:mRNA interferase MazF